MKHISRLFFYSLLLPLFFHSCEDKSKAEPSAKAVRMEITLKNITTKPEQSHQEYGKGMTR